MKQYYKNFKKSLTQKDFQKYCLTLKNTNFLYWPFYLQRSVMLMSVFIGYLFFTYFFESTEEIVAHKKQITALKEKIYTQQQAIQEYKLKKENKKQSVLLSRVDSLNLSNFVGHIAMLAKQNHIEIEAIKPMTSPDQEKNIDFYIHPFQVSAVGEYDHLFQFMQNISGLTDFAIINNFQMTTALAENNKTFPLKLMMIIHLYE